MHDPHLSRREAVARPDKPMGYSYGLCHLVSSAHSPFPLPSSSLSNHKSFSFCSCCFGYNNSSKFHLTNYFWILGIFGKANVKIWPFQIHKCCVKCITQQNFQIRTCIFPTLMNCSILARLTETIFSSSYEIYSKLNASKLINFSYLLLPISIRDVVYILHFSHFTPFGIEQGIASINKISQIITQKTN